MIDSGKETAEFSLEISTACGRWQGRFPLKQDLLFWKRCSPEAEASAVI